MPVPKAGASYPERRRLGIHDGAGVLGVLLALAGCASHSKDLAPVREALVMGDVSAAVTRFEKRGGDKSDLLHLLETGYMMHLGGRWEESNEAFELAEERAEDLYTKSILREAASLLTSDLVLPYRGTSYELQMVQYYRALNYLELGAPEDALVEARKANSRLSLYAEDAGDTTAPRQDAFLQYVTGLLFASEGEWNDAAVSLRDAARLYGERAAASGHDAPEWLVEDYYESAVRVGLFEEASALEAVDPDLPSRVSAGEFDNLVVFLESGFIPFREPVDIVLPIYDELKGDDVDESAVAHRYCEEFRDDIYEHRASSRISLSHVLRFSFPQLVDVPSPVRSCEIILPDGSLVRSELAIDLSAVARREFDDRLPGILLKTIVRAIAKEVARKGSEKKDETLGWVVNAVNVATEQSDTRGWIFLPGRIDLVKARVPEGASQATARFLDADGALVDEFTLEIEAVRGRTNFLSIRTFR